MRLVAPPGQACPFAVHNIAFGLSIPTAAERYAWLAETRRVRGSDIDLRIAEKYERIAVQLAAMVSSHLVEETL